MAGYSFGNGLTLDPGAEIQAGIDKGKQTALSRLLGQAYGAQGDDRQGLLQQAAMIDPGKAMQAQQGFRAQDDDALASFTKKAVMAAQAWQSGDKQMAQGIYASLLPEASSLFPGFQPPQQMDDATAQHFAKLAGQQQQLAPHVIGSALVDNTGKVLYQGQDKPSPSQLVNVPDGQGGTVQMLFDPRTGQFQQPNYSPNAGAEPQILGGALDAAVMQEESGGDPNAVSPAGAQGLMQIMPDTARDPGFGVQPMQDGSPQENMRVGHDYLQALLKRYGNPTLALAAYNGGPGRVDAALKASGGNVPAAMRQLPRETQQYPGAVMSRMGYTPPKATQGGANAPSGYRFTADGSRLEAIPGGPADTGGDYQLSHDAVSNAAWDFIMTGNKPQFARSHEGDKQRIAIQNEVANIAKQAGVSPQELSTQKGKYKALQTSLANTQKASDTMDRQAETFHRNADLMLNLSAQVPRSNMPAINKYLLDFNLKWSGDPKTAAYIAAARTAINEYAKIASGAQGAAGSTDASRREAQDAISAAQTPQQLAQVIKTLKQDAENQRNATHDQLIAIGARMAQFGNQPGAAAPKNDDPLGILHK